MGRFRFLAVLGGCLVLLLAGCAADKGRVLSTVTLIEPINPGVQATLTAAAVSPPSDRGRRAQITPGPLAAGWTWYSNAQMDFAAGIPSGWTAEAQPQENGGASVGVSFVPSPADADQRVARILVMSVPLPADAGKEPLAASELQQQAETWAKGQNLRAVEPTQAAEVAGWPAVRMVLEPNAEDQRGTFRGNAAFVATAERIYYIEVAGPVVGADYVRSTFETFLGGFLSPASLLAQSPAALARGRRAPATVTPRPSTTPFPEVEATVKAQPFLNFRTGPGTDFPKIRPEGLAGGTRVVLLGRGVTKRPWVEVRTTEGITGWVSANPDFLGFDVELSTLPLAFYRPPSGIIDQPGGLGGHGQLAITDSAPLDAVVVLAKDQVTFVAAYVRAGGSFTVDGIPNGTYVVYYSLGTDWDGSAFNRDVQRIRADKDLPFQATGLSVPIWTFIIHAQQGNTGGSPVDSAAFPAVVSDIAGD